MFDSAREVDSVVAALVGAAGVGVAVFFLGFVEVWGMLLAPVVGTALAGAIRAIVRGRRGPAIPLGAVVGGVIGVAANLGLMVVGVLQLYGPAGISAIGLGQLLVFLWPLAHGFVTIYVLYARLKTPGT